MVSQPQSPYVPPHGSRPSLSRLLLTNVRLHPTNLLDEPEGRQEPDPLFGTSPVGREPLLPEPLLDVRFRHQDFAFPRLAPISRPLFHPKGLVEQRDLALRDALQHRADRPRARLPQHLRVAEVLQGEGVRARRRAEQLPHEDTVDARGSERLARGGVVVDEGAVVLYDVVLGQLVQVELQGPAVSVAADCYASVG